MENIVFEAVSAQAIEMLMELKIAREAGDKLYDRKM